VGDPAILLRRIPPQMMMRVDANWRCGHVSPVWTADYVPLPLYRLTKPQHSAEAGIRRNNPCRDATPSVLMASGKRSLEPAFEGKWIHARKETRRTAFCSPTRHHLRLGATAG